MQTLSEALRSIRVMRNLRKQQLVEFRVGSMGVNHGLDHAAHQVLERGRRVFHERSLNEAIDLVYMPLMEGVENGVFVGKVLINRPNTYAGNLCDAIGGDGAHAVALKNTYDRVQHGLNRFACAALPRASPNLLRFCRRGHGASLHKCEQITKNHSSPLVATGQTPHVECEWQGGALTVNLVLVGEHSYRRQHGLCDYGRHGRCRVQGCAAADSAWRTAASFYQRREPGAGALRGSSRYLRGRPGRHRVVAFGSCRGPCSLHGE